ncbi:interleukin 2 receptor, gamma a [Paramisgurnus dabryanus]|uniref:interleukin 2 receptor, gamma a n=1 Tax=Paramisgurnus dabryanus TaxID=90735 RepID=UPI0031F41087
MTLLLFSLYFWNLILLTSSNPSIKCLVINLEYVNCTWSEQGVQMHNYTFESMFSAYGKQICSQYYQVNRVNVGCRIPYVETQRFNDLETWLYNKNGSLVTKQKHQLKEEVKLYPPYNLSVEAKKDTELWLYWNVTQNKNCIDSQVRHRTENTDWQTKEPRSMNQFSLPFPSKKRYEFQVRARIMSSCGQSKYWSEWSMPVYWGHSKPNNKTESPVSSSVTSLVLYAVGATVMLVILSCLLVHSERLRIILIPVVPNAGRNVSKYLAAFFDDYDGNVDKWLSISKDLEKGFKPNFTERACPVREYRIGSQSSSDSGSVLSMPTDMSSDYQCMSYSSASTIPGPEETSQNQPLSPADNPV